MAEPLIVPLPPGLLLGGSCEIRVTALDPTTGDVVSAVRISNVTIEVEDFGPVGPARSGTGPLIRVGA